MEKYCLFVKTDAVRSKAINVEDLFEKLSTIEDLTIVDQDSRCRCALVEFDGTKDELYSRLGVNPDHVVIGEERMYKLP